MLMKYHLALNRSIDLDEITRDAAEGKRPRHVFGMLREKLGATVHLPGSHPVSTFDKLRARLFGQAEVWAMARVLKQQLSGDDVVFCNGEDVAIPIAALCGAGPNRPKVALFAHNLDRPRAKLALKMYRIGERVDLFVTNIAIQVAFLRRFLSFPESKVRLIQDQTDMKFFTPGPANPAKARPIIACVGLEQRDYRTLAEATHDLDVDVRISGFSSDAAVQSRAMPVTLPTNMSQKFYEWPDLVQLYRDADVIAVSLFECKYSAGITTVMEGLSCRRPLVVTRTEGISQYLDDDSMLITPPGDAPAVRQAILKLLDDPSQAEAMADRGHQLARTRHDSDRFADEIANLLAAL